MTGTPTPKKLVKLHHINKHVDSLLNSIDMLLEIEQRRKRYHDLQAQLDKKTFALWANQESHITAGLIRTDIREIKEEMQQILETNITEFFNHDSTTKCR